MRWRATTHHKTVGFNDGIRLVCKFTANFLVHRLSRAWTERRDDLRTVYASTAQAPQKHFAHNRPPRTPARPSAALFVCAIVCSRAFRSAGALLIAQATGVVAVYDDSVARRSHHRIHTHRSHYWPCIKIHTLTTYHLNDDDGDGDVDGLGHGVLAPNALLHECMRVSNVSARIHVHVFANLRFTHTRSHTHPNHSHSHTCEDLCDPAGSRRVGLK